MATVGWVEGSPAGSPAGRAGIGPVGSTAAPQFQQLAAPGSSGWPQTPQ